MNKETKICDACGKALPVDAPGELCPECLLKQALEVSDTESEFETPMMLGSDEGIALGEIPAVNESPGRYTYRGQHGKGGMGRVLLVHDEHLKRDVALKELLGLGPEQDQPTPMRQSMELASRFLREARITGGLEHPSITPVYELGRRKDGTLYYTMKLVRGKTLLQAIREAGSLEKRLELLPHFVDLCQAIAYAHSRGVIHRDIKPANIMVGEFGETAVIDWGLAKVRGQQDDRAEEMTESVLQMQQGKEEEEAMTAYGQAMGTPAYMPPEQAQGLFDKVDERSDIYSLGAVLYEILTGRAPYQGSSAYQIIYAVINEAPKPVRNIEHKAPKDLAAICRKAMAKDPNARYRSAKDLAKAVQSWTPQRRSRALLVVLGIIFALVVLVQLSPVMPSLISQKELTRLKAKEFPSTRDEAMHDPSTAVSRLQRQLPIESPSFFFSSVPTGYLYVPTGRPGDTFPWEKAFLMLSTTDNGEEWNISPENEAIIRDCVARYQDLLGKIQSTVGVLQPSSGNDYWAGLSKGPIRKGALMCVALLELDSFVKSRDGLTDEVFDNCEDIIRLGLYTTDSGCRAARILNIILNKKTYNKDRINHIRSLLRDYGNIANENIANENITWPFTSVERFSGFVPDFISTPLGALFNYHDVMFSIAILERTAPVFKAPFYERLRMYRSLAPEIQHAQQHPWLHRNTSFAFNDAAFRVNDLATRFTREVITETVFELKSRQVESGSFPERLDELVPDFLDKVPLDPCSGEAMRYERTAQGYVLYGVGVNQQDDGGDSGKEFFFKHRTTKDIVYRFGD